MASAVIKKPEHFAGAIDALAGTFRGLNEGARIVEDTRRFDEDMGLKRDTFEEQKHQWDEDMEFRYQNLADLNNNQRLDRDQRDRFSQMEDLRAREMQKAGFDFQEYYAKKVEQPFQADQNAQDRAVQRRGQDKVYSASVYATRKSFEANQTDLEERKRQFHATRGNTVDMASEVLGGNDYNTLTPELQAQALRKAVELDLGQGRLNGQDGVIQATQDEIAQSQVKMQAILQDLPGQREQVVKERLRYAQEEAALKNGLSLQTTGKGTMDLALKTQADTPDWAIRELGVPDRDPQYMVQSDIPKHYEIVGMMSEVTNRLAAEGWREESRTLLLDLYRPQIRSLTMGMYDANPKVQEYYDSMLQNVVYPETNGFESMDIPE